MEIATKEEEATRCEMMKKKHFILVHGLGHGAWCWYKLAARLRGPGHRVTALDLAASGVDPRRLEEVGSFAEYAAPLVDAVAAAPDDERLVLVGHSYSGVALALAMERFPEKIAAAVFATAIMLSPTTPFTVVAEEYFKRNPLEGYMDSKVEMAGGNRGLTVDFGRQYLTTKLYQLSPPEDLDLAMLLMRPGSFFSNEDWSSSLPLTESSYGSVKRVFVLCKEDKGIQEDFQRWMVERSPGAAVAEIADADHMVMLSRPEELRGVLLDVADEYL